MATGISDIASLNSLFESIYEDAMFIARESNIMTNLVKHYSAKGWMVRVFSRYPEITAKAKAEGVDFTDPTVWSRTAGVNLTPAMIMAQAILTDERIDTDPEDARHTAAQELGDAIATKIDRDLVADFSSFTRDKGPGAGESATVGTYYLLMAAVEAGVRTVVMTGSNCAFGHGYRISDRPFPFRYLPLDEEHPSDVEDSYSYSKLAGEELLASFTRAYGLRTYMTRPSGICPPERLQAMAANAKPVTGWSEWLYGYVPSEDLADLQRLILEGADDLPAHDVFIANGADTSLLEPPRDPIARFRPDLLPLAEGIEGHQALFSIDKARRMLGWEPQRGWRQYLA